MDQTPVTRATQKMCALLEGAGWVVIQPAGGPTCEGVLRTLGVSHICAFVNPRAKTRPPGKLPDNICDSPLIQTSLSVTIQFRGQTLGPLQGCLRGSEKSWMRGYALFVVVDLVSLSRQEEEVLETMVDEERSRSLQSVRPQTLRPAAVPEHAQSGEAVCVTFPARRAHAAVFRGICENLAALAGFTGRDVFMIKLAADEVFINAVTHGSEAYGVSRIHSDIVLDNEGMTVTVRDEAGRPFNYHTFQARRGQERPGAVKSGLDLVDRVMDSWAVRTEQGRYTEVTFRKRRASTTTQSHAVCSC